MILEDSTCQGAAKPLCHNYGAHTLESMLHNKRSHRNEKPTHPNKESPLLAATGESNETMKTQCGQKKKKAPAGPFGKRISFFLDAFPDLGVMEGLRAARAGARLREEEPDG